MKNFIHRIASAISRATGPVAKRSRRGAAFPGADLGRLTSSWTTDPGAINRWLRYELRTLRARSRQLCRGDAYAAKFIRACVDNIAGPAPFVLQSKVKKKSSDLPNESANQSIESLWWQWAQPGGCEVTGRLSLAELDRLAIRCIARDGEVLIRKIVSDGKYRLQILDIDRLDEQRNENLPTGAIKMGIQVDNYSKPVAYHVLKQHPGEMGEWSRGMPREYEIIPADQIIHLFVSDWPEQVRGFPWLHAAMTRLWHLGEFENAAVINARVGATKIAVLQTPNGEAPEQLATGRDSVGNLLEDAEPGQYWTLPEGTEISSFNPTFPDAAVEPFIRACLRGAAAGIGMAYHSLANDPASVNYSTARVALLEERDMWKALQQWYIDHLCYPRFRDWISIGILNGEFPTAYMGLTPNDVRFVPKAWGWVDPEKEVNAKKIALDAKLTSRTRIAAENGEDIEEIFDEIAQEEELADSKGIDLNPELTAANAAAEASAANAKPPQDESKSLERAMEAFAKHYRSDSPTVNLGGMTMNAPPINITMPENPTSVKVEPPVVNVAPSPTPNLHLVLPEQKHQIDIKQAPINVSMPEVRGGDVHLSLPENAIRFEARLTMPEQRAPVVNIEPAVVNVTTPEVRAGDVHVTMPEQAAPIVNIEPAVVNVTTPEVRGGDVTVNVPEQPPTTVNVGAPQVTVEAPQVKVEAPVINVDVPPAEIVIQEADRGASDQIIQRDEHGEIVKVLTVRDVDKTEIEQTFEKDDKGEIVKIHTRPVKKYKR